MTKAGIRKAVAECHRFIGAANKVLEGTPEQDDVWGLPGSKETGACRRASMDATRALARMRKGEL